MARRARRLFGVPSLYQWWRSAGVRVTPERAGPIAGEWVRPRLVATRTILYLHGGGYVACSPSTHRPITAALAKLAAADVFVPDYRLAPEAPFPAALNDVERAYRWLLESGVDPNEIALAGDSAGGGLVLALLLRLRDRGVTHPSCAVLFSPWTDLTGGGASVVGNDGRCAVFRPDNIEAFAQCYAPPDLWRDPEVSPTFGQLHGLPPVHIQVDESELLFDDAVCVHEKILSSGGRSELVVYEGLFHGWQLLDGFLPESGAALRAAAAFVRDPSTGRE